MEKGTLIGKGRNAEVIYWEKNQVVKLFWEGIPKERIEFELKVSELVQEYFEFTPKVFGKVEVNDRMGILYEFIDGKNATEVISNSPLKAGEIAKIFANLHVEMHKQKIPEVRPQKAYFEQRIQHEKLLSNTQKQIIIEYLNTLSDDSSLCHGDFHIDNVIFSKNGPKIIDWSELTAGNPHADIARTLYIMRYGNDPLSSERPALLNFFSKFFRRFFTKKYFKSYRNLKDVSVNQMKKWNLIIYSIRLGEAITEEQDYLLKEIEKEIKKLSLIN
jgi:uncharacterized protein (TIGR02172 family)